jgi:hypothetical protein
MKTVMKFLLVSFCDPFGKLLSNIRTIKQHLQVPFFNSSNLLDVILAIKMCKNFLTRYILELMLNSVLKWDLWNAHHLYQK